MTQQIVAMTGLASAPLDAAAHFHAHLAPHLRAMAGDGDVVAVFPPAGHDHDRWRQAAIEELARAAAPHRVNAVVGSDEAAIAQACDYLVDAPGVTGQVLAVAAAKD